MKLEPMFSFMDAGKLSPAFREVSNGKLSTAEEKKISLADTKISKIKIIPEVIEEEEPSPLINRSKKSSVSS
jgi:hypothetical protein